MSRRQASSSTRSSLLWTTSTTRRSCIATWSRRTSSWRVMTSTIWTSSYQISDLLRIMPLVNHFNAAALFIWLLKLLSQKSIPKKLTFGALESLRISCWAEDHLWGKAEAGDLQEHQEWRTCLPWSILEKYICWRHWLHQIGTHERSDQKTLSSGAYSAPLDFWSRLKGPRSLFELAAGHCKQPASLPELNAVPERHPFSHG